MTEVYNAFSTTINAPYKSYVGEEQLVKCLLDIECAKKHPAQVGGFLGEVQLDLQLAFAKAHSISPEKLKAFATDFSDWSGAMFPPWQNY